jgi:hypothetical protein
MAGLCGGSDSEVRLGRLRPGLRCPQPATPSGNYR